MAPRDRAYHIEKMGEPTTTNIIHSSSLYRPKMNQQLQTPHIQKFEIVHLQNVGACS